MRNLFIVLQALICLVAFLVTAPAENGPERNLRIISGRLPVKPETFLNPASNAWQWDTIMAYDTAGGISRYSAQNNPYGNPVSRVMDVWMNNSWLSAWLESYSYNNEGHCDTALFRFGDGSIWTNYWRITYTYNANGLPVINKSEAWQNQCWVNSVKFTTAYNSNGLESTTLRENWQNNSWVNYTMDTCSYDAEWKLILYLERNWFLGGWVDAYKESYTYDANGNLINCLSQHWENNSWVNDYNYLYDNDAEGNVLSMTHQSWISNSWVDQYRESFTYDIHGNSLTGTVEIRDGSGWKPVNGYSCVYSGKQIIYRFSWPLYTYEAVFNSYISGTTEPTPVTGKLKIFPNPAADVITVESPENGDLSIVDIAGRTVLCQKKEQEEIIINIGSLPPGIYFLRFTDQTRVQSLKVVKQ